ncbi:uncharacterized protein LOC119691558 [Plutella xylostella]|uniref:uncharacterized protein LOC119691558 n=1 Tax=Plutella xylostella TaxID=51655 RepID=UPI002032C922|nr:uncharacterized protein LOC119691558 [Plutella xylostella]
MIKPMTKALLVLMLVLACEVRSTDAFEFLSRIYKTISNVVDNLLEVIKQPVIERHNRIMRDRRNSANKVKLKSNLTHRETSELPSKSKLTIHLKDSMKFRKTARMHKFSTLKPTTKADNATTRAPVTVTSTKKLTMKKLITSIEALRTNTDKLTINKTTKPIIIRKYIPKPKVVLTPKINMPTVTTKLKETKKNKITDSHKETSVTPWYFKMSPIKYMTESSGLNVTNITYRVIIPIVPKPRIWHSFMYWNIMQDPQSYLKKNNVSSRYLKQESLM